MQISTRKTKVMAFRGTDRVQVKVVIDGTVLEQVSSFQYLGCSVSYDACNDVVNKFKLMCLSLIHI